MRLAMLGLAPLPALAEPALRTVAQAGAPVKYAPGDARRPGICAEILRAVERVAPGLRFTGQDRPVPLRRVELMLAGGEIDVFFCLISSPERSRQWDYLPVPLYRVRHVVVQRSDDPVELRGFADLQEAGRRKPLLVAQGSVLARALAREQVPFSDAARSDLEALRMLALGRSDAVYGQDLSLLPLLREPGLVGRLRIGATAFQEDVQYAVTARRLPTETVQRLTRALETLEREGFLRALAEKYRQP